MIVVEFELRPRPLERRTPGHAIERASSGLHRLGRAVEPPPDELVEEILNGLRAWGT